MKSYCRHLIYLAVFSLSSCTIVGQYYISNSSTTYADVVVQLNSRAYAYSHERVVSIDQIPNKKIKFYTYKKMDDRVIHLDSILSQYSFTLAPDEMAHISFGANTRLWNVEYVSLMHNDKITRIYDSSHNEFEFRSAGPMRYVSTKEIN